ncbi:putative oxidoreductase [Raoultella terrigena]|uniref:Putative oxidoreductase n=1 Tax=Raoultella terrigena TaxID=577 RepID=A0A4U9CZR4_RAOTE|nr:putative oxidoreductase [Raoultella terrigena]
MALVYGAGPMGLTTIQVLKQVYKVGQVIVVDRIDERLQMAQRNGADRTINNGEHSLAEVLEVKPDADYRRRLPPDNITGGGYAGFTGGQNCPDGILYRAVAGGAAGDYR